MVPYERWSQREVRLYLDLFRERLNFQFQMAVGHLVRYSTYHRFYGFSGNMNILTMYSSLYYCKYPLIINIKYILKDTYGTGTLGKRSVAISLRIFP